MEGNPDRMAETKILIIAKDVEAGQAYAHALSETGVAFDIALSFNEVSHMAVENAYNGLVIDILTLVRSSKEEKIIAYECINLFPVLRVKWENKKKKINLSPLEQSFSPDTETALKFFVESRCRHFPPRSLRKHSRKNCHLNVLLSPDGTFSPKSTQRTFTVSVSLGGVFVYTQHPFKEGEMVSLRFVEFSDQTPIAATVRWSLEWGESRSIPGSGLKFDGLSEAQENELRRILSA
jgi:hypothetical protein